MGKQFLKIAAVYFALSVLLSAIIGVSGDYSLSNIQSHIHLLGWTTLGIIGLIYVQFSRTFSYYSGTYPFLDA